MLFAHIVAFYVWRRDGHIYRNNLSAIIIGDNLLPIIVIA